MKRACLILILLALIVAGEKPLYSQQSGNATLVLFPGVPFGNCNSRQLAINQAANTLYTCAGAGTGSNGTWQLVSGGGGGGWNPPAAPGGSLFGNNTVSTGTPSFFTPGGDVSFSSGNFWVNSLHFGPTGITLGTTGITNGNCLQFSGTSIIGGACGSGGGSGSVTSFSSGSLSPLFTTSVATPGTTPALTFTLSNAPANSMFGNSGSSAALPTWIPIPTGSGGGTTLGGCSTPTSGNFTCDHSLSATVGNEGLLSMPYAGLPTPPATKLGQLAADATGAPYWSVGNGNPFAKLMVADPATGLLPMSNIDVSSPGGLGSIAVLRSELIQCNMMGWSVQGSIATCADLVPSTTSGAAYTVVSSDINRMLFPSVTPMVTYTLMPPTETLRSPFVFWIDTHCGTSAQVTTISGALINGSTSLSLPTCGWAQVWADSDGVDWHAQAYTPPGGVNFVE